MSCANCGNQLAEGSVFCPKCGTKVGEIAPATVSTSTESYFDGGVFQRLGWKILGTLVTVFTFGICYPFAVCWLYDWEAKHTVINGRRLKFVGSVGGLFGTWLLCLLLIVVTLGIYGFWVPLKIKKWRESNTFFEDEIPTFDAIQNLKKEKASYFDGGLWQLIGWELLGLLVTIFTAGICYPWAIQMVYSWEQRHKVYCKRRCTFDGTALELFGTWMLCLLLSLVTLGIYTFWIPIKIKKWQIKHTHLLKDDTPAEVLEAQAEAELSEEEKEARRLAKEKQKKQLKKFGIIAGSVLVVLCVLFHNYIGYWLSFGEYSSFDNYKYNKMLDAKYKKNTKLKEAKISKKTKIIEDYAFLGAIAIKEVNIPHGVTEIGREAFRECRSLTRITIPDSVTKIGGEAFRECYSLTSVTIPDSVTRIGWEAFKDCGSLTSVTISNSVTEIESGAFKDCRSLTSITIPDSVTKIGGEAFRECRSLTSITIPNGVTVIGPGAFERCTSLTSITIPDSVTEIGSEAFAGCDSLKTVNYRGTEEQWLSLNGGYYDTNIRYGDTNYNFNYTGK